MTAPARRRFSWGTPSRVRLRITRLSPLAQDIRMHFEVPSLPHSVKEFAAHYVMIVVSILTALGLEALIAHLHHEHSAENAQHAIETELRTNLSELRINDAANMKRLTPLNDLE